MYKKDTKSEEASMKNDEASLSSPSDVNPFLVRLPFRFFLAAFAASALLSFAAGRLSRVLLKRHVGLVPVQENPELDRVQIDSLPQLYRQGALPRAAYSDHHFRVGRSVVAETRLAKQQHSSVTGCAVGEKGESVCESNLILGKAEPLQNDLPEGSNLLVDIELVDPAFLDSAERLADAMLKLSDRGQIKLLSYHCHLLDPMGVSCVGLSHGSHVSFHTWPVEGVITLDLYSALPRDSVVKMVPLFIELYGVAQREDLEPHLVWALKTRGFEADAGMSSSRRSEASAEWLLGNIELEKRFVASVHSDVQGIEIWDVLDPRFIDYKDHLASLEGNQTYESQHPELFDYDRVLLLDGVLQGRRRGESAYHETLVHPAMFAHEEPKRVAILGSGEGAVLREVLKHDTVEKAVMIEIDKELVEVSREYLSEWNDCSHLVGSTASCFDDPRAEIHYTDATEWFVDRFGVDDKVDENERFDVIIVDVLDSSTEGVASETHVESFDFAVALYNSLSAHGLVVVQTGEHGEYHDPPRTYEKRSQLSTLLNNLEKAGFQNILDFEESHSGYGRSSSYVVAMKDFASRADWFTNEAEVSMKIHDRTLRTKSGESPFRHFDGAHMMAKVFPNRINEERWCREVNNEWCRGHGYDPEIGYASVDDMEVGTSHVNGRAGRGLFAKAPIKQGAYIGLDTLVSSIYLPVSTYDLLWMFYEGTDFRFWQVLCRGYFEGYGWTMTNLGRVDGGVESGKSSFANHGCHGTNNIGLQDYPYTEDTAFGTSIPDPYRVVYNPYHGRHFPQWYHEPCMAIRDIEAGEELLDNYMTYAGSPGSKEFEENRQQVQAMCEGGDGVVAEYESTR